MLNKAHYVKAGSAALIDNKACVFFAYLGAAYRVAFESAFVNERRGKTSDRAFKGTSSGRKLKRLLGFTSAHEIVHFGADFAFITRF